MKTIKWHVSTGFAGCVHEGEFEVEDYATEGQIDDEVREEMFNLISWGWEAKP